MTLKEAIHLFDKQNEKYRKMNSSNTQKFIAWIKALPYLHKLTQEADRNHAIAQIFNAWWEEKEKQVRKEAEKD